ncbi:Methylthioribose-1-phosphate isomerase [Trichoplax sp. H2]|uniref:Methylthioribose-1-phosphate isomerase n=1 Tax=Trichoplax adhaerens TaxID=10228 RepID=MTNA_TRIAD|nr:hypothetical protein TRIADDRAFT_19292 [Trichoplax adhaerens]B3RLE6.1 RecName: Full=Methylthioribose-1-phosphate isomerase; Short=M1Pi; Short=MTR-1-P isomerase; AltName: Full=S-methyl-5-thioribose-1-phosphate isomerase; AltName: Full=Translation initiation factor eIF-2B subunit alpha/beta/delta-like protein [Trichoplax adhaerens]EDV28753.1 hypothetical protein TRIADDRAFT_19292 [Trichoplax adhaerens]RDD41799.1 Methylthioribose-1-phosphate isomerase [Trichoplax sp. H2]|eukprot:XP_002107955.1 hypothetical protein TRIADDRAFT_19292 [Trichoplax adhaerens]
MTEQQSLEAIRYDHDHGQLKILNQLLLPSEYVYENVEGIEDGWQAIRQMKVRGAPAIAIVGMLSLAVELRSKSFTEMNEFDKFIRDSLEHLKTARPTAVNIFLACDLITKLIDNLIILGDEAVGVAKIEVIRHIEEMLHKDVESNKRIGSYGAEAILAKVPSKEKINVLTHCNTGSLATAGYGTALGVIRSLYGRDSIDRVFCTETRPYNQGSRLTAFELVHDGIPATLITDSMASLVMKKKDISAVVVGADRVLGNGDTANKIGTYQLAITAKYHKIPFYIAAPTTTIVLDDSKDIVIEERSHKEVTEIQGIPIAPSGINVYNPAFDVTPAELITGIITEVGVFSPSEMKSKLQTILNS